LILSLFQAAQAGGSIITNFLPFTINLFAGIGAGLIVALILFKLMHIESLQKAPTLLLTISILCAYLLAQNIGGNGIIAVAMMGFIFGNVFSKYKSVIKLDLERVYSAIEIFVFILVGVVVGINWSLEFFRISLGLFLVFLLLRAIVSLLVLGKHSFREKFETAFFVPKGIATVTVAFALLNYSFFGAIILVQLLLAFFVYSLIFDFILDKFGFFESRRKAL
jgi:NhaP-type Na+/H+ and K+/H+ antiporter